MSYLDAFVSCIQRTASQDSRLSDTQKSDLEARAKVEVRRVVDVKVDVKAVRKAETELVKTYSRGSLQSAEKEIVSTCSILSRGADYRGAAHSGSKQPKKRTARSGDATTSAVPAPTAALPSVAPIPAAAALASSPPPPRSLEQRCLEDREPNACMELSTDLGGRGNCAAQGGVVPDPTLCSRAQTARGFGLFWRNYKVACEPDMTTPECVTLSNQLIVLRGRWENATPGERVF